MLYHNIIYTIVKFIFYNRPFCNGTCRICVPSKIKYVMAWCLLKRTVQFCPTSLSLTPSAWPLPSQILLFTLAFEIYNVIFQTVSGDLKLLLITEAVDVSDIVKRYSFIFQSFDLINLQMHLDLNSRHTTQDTVRHVTQHTSRQIMCSLQKNKIKVIQRFI